ncbi:hypothetical protein [Bradyrhizobium embrapense]|uniref:hypothetical protein n=1 Tax=Bradyrhizobium embrapense TaxID=630921 RepID=UPI00067D3C4B|nr:hypothetical protein [Bradyrhizobium embrapense]
MATDQRCWPIARGNRAVAPAPLVLAKVAVMSREPSPRADALRAQREARWERMQAQKRELDALDAAAAAKDAPPAPAAKRAPPKKRHAAKKRRSRGTQNRS